VISTSKLPLETKEISTTSYYSRGAYCYYIADGKGKSIEQIADQMIDEKAIFLQCEHDKIRLIFTHMLKDTVELENVTGEKLMSILNIAMMQSKTTALYAFEDCEVIQDLSIQVKTLTHKDLDRALKKTPNLKTLGTQLFKILMWVLVFIAFGLLQDLVFKYLREASANRYQTEIQTLKDEISASKADYKKLDTTVSELSTEVAKKYDDIVNEL
jgi:cell division protein FtsL